MRLRRTNQPIPPRLTRERRQGRSAENAYEDQCGIQISIVLLDKVTVMIVGYVMEFIVESEVGSVGRPENVWMKTWEGYKRVVL